MELKGRFECYKTANGYFNYRLKAPNNETIAVSGSTELYQDKEGKFRYRLFASNGELFVRCESGYATKDACKKGIASLAKWAENADVVKADK